ncbi:MAG: AI-2E family transporter [Myxococcota bacterium]
MSVRRNGGRVALGLAGVIVIAAGLKAGRPLVAPTLLAAFIAVVTAPLVLTLKRRGLPTSLAVASGLLLDAAAITGVGLLIAVSLSTLSDRLPFYEARVIALEEGLSAWLGTLGLRVTPEDLERLADPGNLVGVASGFLSGLGTVVSRLVMVLILVGFMLVEATSVHRKLVRVIHDRADLQDLREAGREVKAYLVVKTVTSLATGLFAGLLCKVMEIDLWLLWALLAFLLNYIPTIGSIVAAVPVVLLGLVLHGPEEALVLAVGYLLINGIIGNIIEPRFMGQALGLSPLVVFLSMILWGWLLGPVGALLSGPLTMFLKTWLMHTEDLRWIGVLLGPAPDQTATGELVAPQVASEEETARAPA